MPPPHAPRVLAARRHTNHNNMNFALILFLLTLGTGVVWLADKLYFGRRRPADAPEPWWIEYPKSFFPVLLIVFLLRSFLAEPFRIPSSSMRPTLVVGDYILVNKFSYGIRLPIVEHKIIPIADPQRGDVVVFRYPVNPSQDFIKRVVGVGGDVVEYRDKKLAINGQPVPQRPDGSYSYLEGLRFETTERRIEQLPSSTGPREHTIAVNPQMPSVQVGGVRPFPGRDNCDYNDRGFICKVPPGHYFMMGDNRDASDDSRYWGFVPDDHIRGRAFFIWFNWDDIAGLEFQRVGSGIR
jgi:signal peptidase I